ncbi:MAG: hypothetical protein ABIF22_01340 [bacterium]
MSIKDFAEKIKLFLGNIKDKAYGQEKGLKIKEDLYIVIMIILVGTASFGLGKISSFEKNKTPISILRTKELITASVLNSQTEKNNTAIPEQTNGEVVASKSGTKYYYPWCSGVSRIKEENKVWFNNIEEARATGLTPAANCTGLK